VGTPSSSARVPRRAGAHTHAHPRTWPRSDTLRDDVVRRRDVRRVHRGVVPEIRAADSHSCSAGDAAEQVRGGGGRRHRERHAEGWRSTRHSPSGRLQPRRKPRRGGRSARSARSARGVGWLVCVWGGLLRLCVGGCARASVCEYGSIGAITIVRLGILYNVGDPTKNRNCETLMSNSKR